MPLELTPTQAFLLECLKTGGYHKELRKYKQTPEQAEIDFKIAKLLNDKVSPKKICGKLGVGEMRINRVKKEMVEGRFSEFFKNGGIKD